MTGDASHMDEWSPPPLDIPQHWEHIDFEDAFENVPISNLKIPQKQYFPAGEIPIVDQGVNLIGGFTNDVSRRIQPTHKLIVFGDHTKCFKLIGFPFAPGADGIKVLKPNIIDAQFAYFACLALRLPDRGYSRHFSFLKKSKLPLAPLKEQHRIVDKIEKLFSELDKGIESLKTARAQLKVYRQAVLKHAFEGKLTAQWREENKDKLETPEQLLARIKQERVARYEAQLEDWKTAVKGWEAKGKPGKKPTKPKPANDQSIAKEDRECLLNLPNGWAWIGLAQLFSTSPQNGVYKPASEYGSGTQIIRIDDFYDGQLIRRTGFKKLRLSNEEIEKYKVRNLDLIINRVNSIEFLGKCALVDSLTEDTVFESNIMKCCVIEDVISKSYVAVYLASHEGRNRLCKNAKHAVNQASINQTDVGNTLVPITSIEEQLLIVKKTEQKLSQADALIFQIEGHLKKAEALRQSTLKRAFSGQLVAQDPGDEPASFLLDRIRAEKAQASGSRKTTKKTRKKRKTAA